jgi:hypothetical protein
MSRPANFKLEFNGATQAALHPSKRLLAQWDVLIDDRLQLEGQLRAVSYYDSSVMETYGGSDVHTVSPNYSSGILESPSNAFAALPVTDT